jgi:VWFA-related protein
MKSPSTRWPVVVGAWLSGVVLIAQVPPAAQQPPTFRMNINVVTTDVIVRDAQGQFVADLKKEDFAVSEDGVKQEIASLVMVHGGRTYNLQLPAPPPPAEGIILPPARPTNDAAGRIFVIFIDDLHLDFKNTARIRDLVKKVKDLLVHQGDMFTIVSTGTSSIAIDLTYDIKRFDEAIKKIMGGALKATDIIQGPEGAEGPSEVRYRAHVAFATAYDLMKQLEAVHNRRKAMIYISNGYDFNPFPKARSGEGDSFFERRESAVNQKQAQDQSGTDSQYQEQDPTTRQGNIFADADLARELSDLTRAANRANTTIYTIDSRGLVGMPDIDEKVDPTEFQQYLSNSINSLRVLAEQTGGIPVVNQNDFTRALKRIDAETSDYYMLGYYSSNPDPLKRTRQIDVKIKRKDVDVWSRKSYSLRSAPRK